MAIDRKDAVPLYHQIFLALRDEIIRGERPFGTPVPTEHELGARFSVSRITARRALDELASNGYVERRRRTGTRVIYRSPVQPIEANIDQALESLLAFGRDTKVRVIEIVREVPDPAIAARLGLSGEDEIVRAVRLRSLNDAPLGIITSYLPGRFGKLATRRNLTARPILALLGEAGVTIGGAAQTIEAVVAVPDLAAMLEIEARAPVLSIERLVKDREGVPVLLTRAQYRADRYRISLDLYGSGRLGVDMSRAADGD